MKTLYTAVATATDKGRNGHTRTDDGKLDLDLSMPEAMGGPGGDGTNPEQLFAAGYAACFANALRSSARRDGDEAVVDGSTVTAHVDIGAIGGGRFGLGVRLEVSVPALAQQDAEALVAKAHERCPYSNATRGNIDVVLDVRGR
jgi:Ohr subfamily peroxiredoxin